MKFLKKAIKVLVVIIAIPLVAAIFMKKEYSVIKKVTIDKPKNEVFSYLKLLKNQDNYSKWAKMDPNMKKSYTGIDGTIGFISAWDSNKEDVGKGEQEIIKIKEGKRIDFELRFLKPFESTEKAYFITRSISEKQTEVTWGFNGQVAYPWNFMMLFMDIENMIGNDLEIGLKNLKKILK